MIPFSEVIEIVEANSEHFRKKAEEQQRIADRAWLDGYPTLATDAEVRADYYRQKARELEAKIP